MIHVPYRAQLTEKYAVIASLQGPVLIYVVSQTNLLNDKDPPTQQFDAGRLGDMAVQSSSICTAGADGILRLWSAESG